MLELIEYLGNSMTKPAPIVLIATCLVAACMLAFTIADHFEQKKKRIAAAALVTKNNSALFVTRNPPHGKPGHRHDLPDGAPLPVASVNSSTSSVNNSSLQNLITQPDSIAGESLLINPPHGKPGHTCSVAVGAPLNSALANEKPVATSMTAKEGINPPHGQPGHRCDIAVGASLNSVPAKTTSTATAKTPSGINPPHGQPGHRCDIAVGAPLNSPKASPSSSAATTNSTKPVAPNYSFTPMNDSSKPATPQFEYDSTGAALNPPHGKPGHDCTIAVGKPLKK